MAGACHQSISQPQRSPGDSLATQHSLREEKHNCLYDSKLWHIASTCLFPVCVCMGRHNPSKLATVASRAQPTEGLNMKTRLQ